MAWALGITYDATTPRADRGRSRTERRNAARKLPPSTPEERDRKYREFQQAWHDPWSCPPLYWDEVDRDWSEWDKADVGRRPDGSYYII